MSNESLSSPPQGNQWRLPSIESMEMRLVRFREPRIVVVGRDAQRARQAIEFLVRTASELPARALSPALFVGDVAVPEYEWTAGNTYRFLGFDVDRYTQNAVISFGWPQFPATRVATRFRYRLSGPLVA